MLNPWPSIPRKERPKRSSCSRSRSLLFSFWIDIGRWTQTDAHAVPACSLDKYHKGRHLASNLATCQASFSSLLPRFPHLNTPGMPKTILTNSNSMSTKSIFHTKYSSQKCSFVIIVSFIHCSKPRENSTPPARSYKILLDTWQNNALSCKWKIFAGNFGKKCLAPWKS